MFSSLPTPTLPTNYTFSGDDDIHDYQKEELNLYYAICEALVAALAVVGNALVILVFRKERRLRRRTNYYIVSLAAADFLVGLLGIPFAVMASVGLPTNLYACLFTVSLLVVLCTISIFCLLAVSVDRYWAILHPMGYSRNVRTKTALATHQIPSYEKLGQAKLKCYPENVFVQETEAFVQLQDLVDHTATRLILTLDENVIESKKMTLHHKWGFDGSAGHSQYKQVFEAASGSDSAVLITTLVPLRLSAIDQSLIMWENNTPSSTRFCRPIRISFEKESVDSIKREADRVMTQISQLNPTTLTVKGKSVTVCHELLLTMVDGKVINTLEGNKATSRCYICDAGQKNLNDLPKNHTIHTDRLKYGTSPLHARIKFLEYLLRISYRLGLPKTLRPKNTRLDCENKAILQAKKTEIQDAFRKQLGLTVDMPKQVIISVCWFAGTVIGFLPLMGWHKGPAENGRCFFLGVMDYNYLVFLYFGTIITPALLLAVFYAHIYHVVLKQLRQIVTINPGNGAGGRSTGGTMLRMLGAAQKREVKATQNLSIIVLFFMICWIPLYTINCVLAFCKDCKVNSTFMLFCIILSHLNSAGNPLLYAYHLRDFRAALKQFICGGGGNQPPGISNFNNNNFTHFRGMREARSTMSLSKNRLIGESQFGKARSLTLPTPPKIATLVQNSVALAALDASRDIWRISEISDEQPRRSSSGAIYNSHSGNYAEGDDDVFIADTVAITEITADREIVIPAVTIQKTNNLSLSTSSPQLSRGLFLVEDNRPRFLRSVSVEKKSVSPVTGDFIHSPAKSLKLSPFKAVGELLKTRHHPRSSSLSDDPDNSKKNNGYIPENNSCGN